MINRVLDFLYFSITKRGDKDIFWVENYLSENATFIDVGANKGLFSYVASQKPYVDVHTFEPNPLYYRRLQRLKPSNNFYPLALSDFEGTTQMKVPIFGEKYVGTRGTLNIDFLEEEETSQKVFDIEVSTLDTLFKHTKVHFIKIDVEGHELNVLKGAAQVLLRDSPLLLVEIEKRHNLENAEMVFDLLEKHGYVALFLDSKGGVTRANKEFLFDYQKDDDFRTERYINNFFFIQQEDLAKHNELHRLFE